MWRSAWRTTRRGAEREVSVGDQGEWFGKIEDGVARFMKKWRGREAETSAERQLANEEEAETATPAGPTNKEARQLRGGGR